MEKLNLNKIIGYILLSPALLSVVLFFNDFIASFFRANNDLLIHHLFAKMSPQWHGYGSPHTSALPFYFGLMAIAGALLVINSTKKEIK